MKNTKPEPAWMQPCRKELLKLDPRYLVVFNERWQHFGGDCTAAQLARYLQGRGYDWAPSDRTTRDWLAVILPIEAKHKQAITS